MEKRQRFQRVYLFYLGVSLALVLIQAAAVPTLIRLFFKEFDFLDPRIILAVKVGICLFFGFIDVVFFVEYPLALRRLRSVEPVTGSVEGFLISARAVRGEVRHCIDPIVRLPGRDGYYVTYRKYSRSWFGSYVVTVNRKLQQAELIRKDGSVVKLGDSVTVYLSEPVSKRTTVCQANGRVQVEGEPDKHQIQGAVPADLDGDTLQIFRGAVDIEQD